jgi:hypothetical protein
MAVLAIFIAQQVARMRNRRPIENGPTAKGGVTTTPIMSRS